MRQFLIAAAIALGAAVTPAVASEAYSGARGLDTVEVAFTRHNREHRMWEIQRTQEMMQRRGGYGHRGQGYGHRGYGYGRGHGGPPPHARAYGRRDRDRYYNRY